VRDVLDATSKVLFSRRKTRAESIAFCDRLTIRVAPAPRTPLQKAKRRKARGVPALKLRFS